MKKKQNVVIKGTKEGLTFHLCDACSFEDLKRELEERLSENSFLQNDGHPISVKVHSGNRFLTEDQKDEIRNIIGKKKNLIIESFDANVITKEEAKQMMAQNEIVSVARIVRSGQILAVPGDLLLVGDVNPGGMVMAGGNIFIMGALKGIAHAGVNGNSSAIISASVMKPTQLRISDCITRAPDGGFPDNERKGMECAYIDEDNRIVIDRLQVLIQLRPNLTRLEGGF